MCIKIYYQFTCGHISVIGNEFHPCEHETGKKWHRQPPLPETRAIIDTAKALCKEISAREYKAYDGNCSVCVGAARRAAAAKAKSKDSKAVHWADGTASDSKRERDGELSKSGKR